MIDILNDYTDFEKSETFRRHCIRRDASTELGLINRYINGETSLRPGFDFSEFNLELIKKLIESEEQ